MAAATLSGGAVGPALDTTVRLVTPERITFQYPLAGPFRRLAAYLIDLAVLLLLMMLAGVLGSVTALGSEAGAGLMLAGWFGLVWGYGIVWEGTCNGRTPGKRAVGLRVVSDQGVPITPAQAIVRNLVGTVDGILPTFYMAGLASMLLTAKFQRLGDLAAGTMVIVEEARRRVQISRVDHEPPVRELLPFLPLRVAAGPDLSRALGDYVKTRTRLGVDRREEMAAALAGPIRRRYGLPESSTADAVLCALYHRVFLGE